MEPSEAQIEAANDIMDILEQSGLSYTECVQAIGIALSSMVEITDEELH